MQPVCEHAGHQHHAKYRDRSADALARRDLLPENSRGKQEDKYRGHVVAHRGRGDGGIIVSLKQENPVKAQHRAEEQQLRKIPFHRRALHRLMPDRAHQQQKHKPDHRPRQRHDA